MSVEKITVSVEYEDNGAFFELDDSATIDSLRLAIKERFHVLAPRTAIDVYKEKGGSKKLRFNEKLKELGQTALYMKLNLNAVAVGGASAQAPKSSKWKSLVPLLMKATPPRTQTLGDGNEEEEPETLTLDDDNDDEEEQPTGTKRKKNADENYDDHYRDSISKKLKLWRAHKKPIAVPTTAAWYLGEKGKGDELFLRQSTEDCFDLMWSAVERSKEEWTQKGRDGHVAFVLTGAPGLGKSWCSNAMVWYLLKKRQSLWFHSAAEKTLTEIKFIEGEADPVVIDRIETDVHSQHPAAGTWFLYDSAGSGSAAAGQTVIPFTKQPVGVPCIIFSSPKDSNYRIGIRPMESSPRGGKVWYLWLPTFEWFEIEAVIPSVYSEYRTFAGKQSKRGEAEFREFIKAMYDIWGGIPRRFSEGYTTLEEKGKGVAIAEAQQKLKLEMDALAPKLIQQGPMIETSMLDAIHQSGESDSRSRHVAPPSWLIHPLPIESAHSETFRSRSYRFCSRQAEVLFLKHLEASEVGVIRTFCRQVFNIPAGYGLAFERFAHFVLTRIEVGDYQWRKYNEKFKHKLTLPRCTPLPKCDMKTDLTGFQGQIEKCIQGTSNVVIDPLSDQQDAIDMFMVLKDGPQVLAMQDTISKTHSFHPVKILEYRNAAKAAFEKVGTTVPTNFFHHVVVVPTENESSQFQLQLPVMPGLDSVGAVKTKFTELGLTVPLALNDWTQAKAKQACKGKVKNFSSMKGEALLTKGAEVLLVQAAKEEVELITSVLDGFF